MRKLFLSVAALAMLSTASSADQMDTYNQDELRRERGAITMKIMENQMAVIRSQQEMLTAFQVLLKKAMERDTAMDKGGMSGMN